MLSLIDTEPMRPMWGRIWQAGELAAVFDAKEVGANHLTVTLILPIEDALGFGYELAIHLADTEEAVLPAPTLLATVDAIISFLRQGDDVLIHCFEGKYRSTYIDTAVHMRVLDCTADQALRSIQARHPIAALRRGTLDQLRQMEAELRAWDDV